MRTVYCYGRTVGEVAEDHPGQKLLIRVEGHLTCSMYGVSEHLGCSRCGIPLSEFTTTDPTEHTPVTIEGAEPTCTRRGYTESVKCSECNAVIVEPVYSDPLGHTFSNNVCTVCGALADSSLKLATKYYGLYEADTLHMICEKNADVRIEPASLTKLLTAATALKYMPEDTVIAIRSVTAMQKMKGKKAAESHKNHLEVFRNIVEFEYPEGYEE
jgi:hypothetical protein